MKNNHVTATAQGISYVKDGNVVFQHYDKTYQSKVDCKNEQIQRTQEDIEKLHLNMIQRQMYRRLMYGLKEYTPQEIATFSPKDISKIVEDYKYAKRVLQVIKSKKYFKAENKLINAIFPQVNAGKNDFDWYMDIPKDITLRKLGISTKEVIDAFIKRRLLPNNFFKLTSQNVLPC